MNHRILRVKELIRREVGTILEKNFSFNGVLVTIHDVDLTPDFKQCFVYVGVLGKGDPVDVVLQKLNEGRGMIQRQLFKRVVLKNSPTLVFKHTDSIERGVRVLNLIQNLPPPALDAEPDAEHEEGKEFEDDDIHPELPPLMPANDSFEQIGAALKDARAIAVACHVRPDGDAIGSIVGFARSMIMAGKTVHSICEDGVPENLAFLPLAGTVQQSTGEPLDIDVAVALDTATKERLGERTLKSFSKASLMVNMDHHGTNPRYGHLNHIDVASPATGQIIYEFLVQQGLPMDDAVRQNLFAAISTDTGSFQYSSTTARTHRIIAEMMEAGLETAELSQKLYDEHPMRHMLLLKAQLNEMKLSADNRIASWALTLATQESVKMLPGDTEGLIDTLRTIEGVIAAVIFEELPGGKVRVSARSKDARLNVSKVCAQFGGGGHAMAAGARLPGPIAEAERIFLEALTNEISGIG